MIETRKHEPIIYEVHDYITDRAGTIIGVDALCLRFFGKHTKSYDTKMRNIVEEIVNDRLFQKLIISTHDGYLCPTNEQEPLVINCLERIEKTAKALFYRRSSLIYRLQHDGQFKGALGKFDSKVFEAYADEEPTEAELEMARKQERERELDRVIIVPEIGQVGIRF